MRETKPVHCVRKAVRKKLIIFFALTFFITWAIWSPYYLAIYPPHWRTKSVFHLLGAAGPALAALLTAWITDGNAGLRTQLRESVRSGNKWYWALALLLPFAINFIARITSGQASLNPLAISPDVYSAEFSGIHPAIWMSLNIFIYGFGEECGWRGYAIPRMQERIKPLAAAILFSALWALWHWPLFFYPNSGYYTMNVAGIAGWLTSLVTGSILLSWIYNNSRKSVIACALFHGAMDIAFAGGNGTDMLLMYVGIIITILGVIAAISLYLQGRQTTIVSSLHS